MAGASTTEAPATHHATRIPQIRRDPPLSYIRSPPIGVPMRHLLAIPAAGSRRARQRGGSVFLAGLLVVAAVIPAAQAPARAGDNGPEGMTTGRTAAADPASDGTDSAKATPLEAPAIAAQNAPYTSTHHGGVSDLLFRTHGMMESFAVASFIPTAGAASTQSDGAQNTPRAPMLPASVEGYTMS